MAIATGMILAGGFSSTANSASAIDVTTRKPPPDSCYQGDIRDVLELVDKAVALLEQEGERVAFARFMDPADEFVRGDLYVFVLDRRGRVVANGDAPESVGANSWLARDLDGSYFIQEILQRAFNAGDGWTSYHWYSPCTGKLTVKQVFFKRSGRYVLCSGYYQTLSI